jgi:transcriptional repressor NrdR
MKCPFCHFDDSKVTDSRLNTETNTIRRRRECLQCQKRFSTLEMVDLTIQVKKRDGTYEEFNQEKVLKGLEAATLHSKISHGQVRSIVNEITASLIASSVKEISAQELGEIVMEHLKKIDIVAYIRFACVYKRFKHIDDVREAIESIIPKDEGKDKKHKNEEYYGIEKRGNS